MGLLRRIFSGPDVVRETISMVRDAGDALVFTAEEKAEFRAKSGELLLKIFDKSEGGALARRLVALVVTGVWAFAVVLTLVIAVAGVWIATGALVTLLVELILKLVLPGFLAVMTFYFGHRILTK